MNGRNRKFEETYPGCLGRMMNLFELNTGVSATNRLLNDKPHQDGSPASRRTSSSGDQIKAKVNELELKNAKSMKMLMAREMSKEVDSRHNPTNLVAKLMGLDSLPQQEPGQAIQRSHSRGHPQNYLDIPMSCWEHQNGLFHNVDPNKSRNVYEIWQQSQESPCQERYEETMDDKRMALVRQKFMEAKRLSMDEKHQQSKQFQDALEVLNSNKDLFLKCLQEPNPVSSNHLYNRQSVTSPPATKRITVLRPTKMVGTNEFADVGRKCEEQTKIRPSFQLNGLEKIHPGSPSPASLKCYESSAQPTRIVVLKPSAWKAHDVKVVDSPQTISHSEDFFEDENKKSAEVAKAITQQMLEKLGRHHRDETGTSSVFSNGYVGDESSSSKSEIEYVDGNLADSEVISPVRRHSWNYIDRLGSPYISSFNQAPFSPESSVCREAKKRLCERWTMMASDGSGKKQRHVHRSSSTLGEMLALSETKEAESPGEEGSYSEEPKDSNALLVSEQRREENMDNVPRNLVRSKSAPLSCTEFGNRLSIGKLVSDKEKPELSKEDAKARSIASSLTGKVSSLFFSRNKKLGKEKSLVSETKDEFHTFPGEFCSHIPESVSKKSSNHALPSLLESSSKASSSYLVGMESITSDKTAKPVASGNAGEQDQPSPISVLDPSFEEDEHIGKIVPLHVKFDQHGAELPLNSIRSNWIDKSPSIGTIARALSWDDTASSDIDEEQEWFSFVKTLLSVAGLEDEVHSNTFLAKWHSPESPLDPSIRDKYVDLKNEDTLHEAKQRQKRSVRQLVFDLVNAALVDIDSCQRWTSENNASSTLADEVWAQNKLWFSGEVRCKSDDNSMVMEVVGKEWNNRLTLEMYYLGEYIGGRLVEELVQEAVVELTGIQV